MKDSPIFLYDSVTKFKPDVVGSVVIAASHAGIYAAYVAAMAGVKGAILNDAGIGRDNAGVAGLGLLEDCGIAAAAVSHLSCRIGDSNDTAARGRISTVNAIAGRLGVVPGMAVRDAAAIMAAAGLHASPPKPMDGESRTTMSVPGGFRLITLIDSASLVTEEDRDAIVITGSHGGLLGQIASTAIKYPVFAALYNDADTGIDRAGVSRLPVLDDQGIAAATVSASSARIGSAASSYDDGILSCINRHAQARGARIGMAAREFADMLARQPLPPQ